MSQIVFILFFRVQAPNIIFFFCSGGCPTPTPFVERFADFCPLSPLEVIIVCPHSCEITAKCLFEDGNEYHSVDITGHQTRALLFAD